MISMTENPCRIAIIGGGITGAVMFRTLAKLHPHIFVDLYDQGRCVGGRSSSRCVSDTIQFDHGCQFFRSDTSAMKAILSEWLSHGWISNWDGEHIGRGDFFGLPTNIPVYISSTGGIHNVPMSLIEDVILSHSNNFTLFEATRIENLTRNLGGKWEMHGKNGRSALHDTPEAEVTAQSTPLHDHDGYDFVVLTDISSSFENWHRASAGVPEDFSRMVREKAGARVPLFSCMVAFEEPLNLTISSMTFEESSSSLVWFAARNNSKIGFADTRESWTIISTPEYALRKISETPMQDPDTGAFIPQSADYLLTVPAPELCNEFLKLVGGSSDSNGERKIAYINAQRWGSALPAHKHLARDGSSPTRQTLAGVSYDSGRAPLAPTTLCAVHGESFICDDSLGLLQCGDMVSSYTPGFEGAVLSASAAAAHLAGLIQAKTGAPLPRDSEDIGKS